MRRPGITREKGIIAWFAANHVAANLLMIMIIVGGLITAGAIRKETNPNLEFNLIQVRVPYMGAAPQEVEEGVILKLAGQGHLEGQASDFFRNLVGPGFGVWSKYNAAAA